MNSIQVVKLKANGEISWKYPASVVLRSDRLIVLKSTFDHEDVGFLDVVLQHGDYSQEYFFNDRRYTIFGIRDRENHQLKGWYCDICQPAEFYDHKIVYRDHALDLWVYPDGRMEVMDQDEFDQLDLSEEERQLDLKSLNDLKENFFNILKTLPKIAEET